MKTEIAVVTKQGRKTTQKWETREGLIRAVRAVRKFRVCGYTGDRCDCKYGIHTKKVRRIERHPGYKGPDPDKLVEVIDHTSEQTGCPELYEVLALLTIMTKKEFETLRRRMTNPAQTRAALKRVEKLLAKDA